MWPFDNSKDGHNDDSPAGAMFAPPAPEIVLEELPPTTIQKGTTSHQSLTDLINQGGFHLAGYPNERLGMPLAIRAPFLTSVSFITGFGLGATTGGRRRADRFRAENSHRFPTTQAGWYLYHRSKSYNTTVGAATEGVKFGGQLAAFAGVFMAVEEIMDRSRARLFARRDEEYAKGQRDAANTVVAGMSTVGLYIGWKRMDVFAAGKMARLALKYSLAYGVAQDALGCLKGEQPGYVRWVLAKIGRGEEEGMV